MAIIFFQSSNDGRYHELSDDHPARREDGTMGLLKEMTLQDNISVFMNGSWVPGWTPPPPKTYEFVVSCVSFEDEGKVAAALHRGLIGYYEAKDSPIPWHKIIPPSKQCFNLPDETYLVIARDDRQPDGEKGRYSLATRRMFATETEASDYAVGISSSREPLVVPGCYSQLRKDGR